MRNLQGDQEVAHAKRLGNGVSEGTQLEKLSSNGKDGQPNLDACWCFMIHPSCVPAWRGLQPMFGAESWSFS